jgi:hypothetical protein
LAVEEELHSSSALRPYLLAEEVPMSGPTPDPVFKRKSRFSSYEFAKGFFHQSQSNGDLTSKRKIDPLWHFESIPKSPTGSHRGQLCQKCEPLNLKKILQMARDHKTATTAWRMYVLGQTSDINECKERCTLCRLIYYAIECSTPLLEHLDSKSKVVLDVGSDWTVESRQVIRVKVQHKYGGGTFFAGLSFSIPSLAESKTEFVDSSLARRDSEVEAPAYAQHPPLLRCPGDIDVAEHLLRDCVSNHKGCHVSVGRTAALNIFVIDTMVMNIIKVSTSVPYFALSYVWGGADTFQLTNDNVEKMAQADSLRKHWKKIPKVIQQSIKLVRELSIFGKKRYLWVDALCIIQDNSSFKHSQIAHMDIIYGQACMTIAAVSSATATDHMLRHEDKRDLAQLEQDVNFIEQSKRVRIQYKKMLLDHQGYATSNEDIPVNPDLSEPARLENTAVYFTRGWTFQEQALSRRLMLCTPRGISFQCRQSRQIGSIPVPQACLWGVGPPDVQRYGQDPNMSFATQWWPENLRLYIYLAQDYTRRDLTFRTDILQAFAGVTEALLKLSTADLKPFVCGLPLGSISDALFWTSVSRNVEEKQEKAPEGIEFPTWSWANSSNWQQSVVYPPHLYSSPARETTGEAELLGIEVLDQAPLASSSKRSSPVKAKGKILSWRDRQIWDTLPVDTFAVLRIKAYAAPWFPEFTLKPIKKVSWDLKTGLAWQSRIDFDNGTTKGDAGTVSLDPEAFSSLNSDGLFLIQLSKSSVPDNETSRWESRLSIAALIVRRGKVWWERVGIARLSGLVDTGYTGIKGSFVPIFEHRCTEMEFELA